jgi:hypothetical protein
MLSFAGKDYGKKQGWRIQGYFSILSSSLIMKNFYKIKFKFYFTK